MLHVHVGQAGGQVGSVFARYSGCPSHDGYGHVFIDSEPKVIKPLVTDEDPARIPFLPPSSVICDHSGRGNNWAWGYTNVGSRYGKEGANSTSSQSQEKVTAANPLQKKKLTTHSLLERSVNSIRKHADMYDKIEGISMFHSLGGGTGSGFGSKLLEVIRDEFPKARIIDCVIAPFSSGDTPLQHYNTILSISKSQKMADAIIFYDNDDLLARVSRIRKNTGTSLNTNSSASAVADTRARMKVYNVSNSAFGSPKQMYNVNTKDINLVIAESLSCIFLPYMYRKSMKRIRKKNTNEGKTGNKPKWHDLRIDEEERKAKEPKPFENLLEKSPEENEQERDAFPLRSAIDTDDDEDDREGWIRASLKPSTSPSNQKDKSTTNKSDPDSRPTNINSGSSALIPSEFNPVFFVEDLVPQPSTKFLDIRTAFPLVATNVGVSIDSPACSWISLTENLVDLIPRYDAASRIVQTRAVKLVARGASQADSDSVDPTLEVKGKNTEEKPPIPTKNSRTGAGMRPVPIPWPGMPTTGEWERVGMMLSRAYTWSSGSVQDSFRTCSLTPNVPSSILNGERRSMLPLPMRSLTAISNSDFFVPSLVRAISRAEALLSVSAYIHWYQRFGVSEDDIMEALHDSLDIVEAYQPSQ